MVVELLMVGGEGMMLGHGRVLQHLQTIQRPIPDRGRAQ